MALYSLSGPCGDFGEVLCKNGGTCINMGGKNYRCECMSGYTGLDCTDSEEGEQSGIQVLLIIIVVPSLFY